MEGLELANQITDIIVDKQGQNVIILDIQRCHHHRGLFRHLQRQDAPTVGCDAERDSSRA